MKKGVLLYHKADAVYNKGFINMLIEKGRHHALDLQLHLMEEIRDEKGLETLLTEKNIDFALNRTRIPEVSAFFERKDIWVCNSSKACRLGNDKAVFYQKFKEWDASIPMAETMTFSAEELKSVLYAPEYESIRKKLPVLKSVQGHGGEQVFLLETPNGCREHFRMNGHDKQKEDFGAKQYYKQLEKAIAGDVFILQEFLPIGDMARDVRVYILGNKIYAAVLRQGKEDFRANYSLGGSAELFTLPEETVELVNRILTFCPLEYGGIDFILDKNDRWILNEIEDMAGARMLYQISDMDIAEDLVCYLSGEDFD